jgi:hypothetical protein
MRTRERGGYLRLGEGAVPQIGESTQWVEVRGVIGMSVRVNKGGAHFALHMF